MLFSFCLLVAGQQNQYCCSSPTYSRRPHRTLPRSPCRLKVAIIIKIIIINHHQSLYIVQDNEGTAESPSSVRKSRSLRPLPPLVIIIIIIIIMMINKIRMTMYTNRCEYNRTRMEVVGQVSRGRLSSEGSLQGSTSSQPSIERDRALGSLQSQNWMNFQRFSEVHPF